MKLRDTLVEKIKTINEDIYELYSREVLKWCDQFMPNKLEKLFIGSDGAGRIDIDTLNAEIDKDVTIRIYHIINSESRLTRDHVSTYFESKTRPSASRIVASWLVEEGFKIETLPFYLNVKM
jgi:hypothetical protein